MNHWDILRQSLRLTWRSKALWVFGILLALTSGSGVSVPRGNFRYQAQTDLPPLPPAWPIILIGLLLFLLFVALVALIVRYVAEVGLYRLIDEEISYDRPASVGRGFRLGWDRRTLRLLGIDLLIGIPLTLFAIAAILAALSPLLLLGVKATAVRLLAIGLAVGLGLVTILVLAVIGAILGVWRQIVARAAVLDDRSWLDSLREGYHLCLRHLNDVALMALIMWGVSIAWGVVLIPVVLALGAVAFVAGFIPGWLLATITGVKWLGMAIGVPIGLIIFVVPMAVLQGIFLTFHAGVWTITYRELTPAPVEAD
ncbi:MAG: hypothetical protein Kow0047_33790 [Anaerolineae bacterium]